MSVFIRGNHVGVGGQAQNTGVFIGQNVQHGWDSITPMKVASGFSMGDASVTASVISYYLGTALDWQSIHDEDVKGNFEKRVVR